MRQVDFCEIKVGDLLAPDPDCFMLGDRWIVESVDDTDVEIQIYHCGVCLPRNNWYHSKISKDNRAGFRFWTREETLESWISYYTSDEKRITFYNGALAQLKEMGYDNGYSIGL